MRETDRGWTERKRERYSKAGWKRMGRESNIYSDRER